MYDEQPYALVALHSEKRESSNAYQCMLQALIEGQAVANSVERYDIRALSYRKGLLRCENNAFVSYSLKDNKERARFIIPQTKKALTSLTVFNISKIIERIMITGYIRKVSIKS